jgi:sirohydrochlorin cobaltochelatase
LEEAKGQAEGAATWTNRDSTCHLLVGRGSRDESATAEMHEFARLCAEATSQPTEVAFLAMANPSLAEQLRNLPLRGYQRIVVRPHLLFHGELVEALGRQVDLAKLEYPRIQWFTAKPLADPPGVSGPASQLLETVILDRCRAVADDWSE